MTRHHILLLCITSVILSTQAFQTTTTVTSLSFRSRTTSLGFANDNTNDNTRYWQKLRAELAKCGTDAASVPANDEMPKSSKRFFFFVPFKRLYTKMATKATGLVPKARSLTATVKKVVTERPTTTAKDAVSPRDVTGLAPITTTKTMQRKQGIAQPLSRRQEEKLAAKYASIDCLEERAYTILKDLGMVEPTLDFSI